MPSSSPTDRDRFVAFAFAAADLLLEIDGDDRIVYATGAAHAITGRSGDQLIGQPLGALFAQSDRPMVGAYFSMIGASGRQTPIVATTLRPDGRYVRITLGGCALPQFPHRRFVSVARQPLGYTLGMRTDRDAKTGLLSESDLIALAGQAAADGSDAPTFTLVRIKDLEPRIADLPQDAADVVLDEIGALLRARSVDGDAAARLGPDVFGLIGPPRAQAADLADALDGLAQRHGGLFIQPEVAQMALDGCGLEEHDSAKALVYAIRKFAEGRDGEFTLTSLAQAVTEMTIDTAERLGTLRRAVDDGPALVFQPIVGLDDQRVHHCEVLARFPDQVGPQEMIRFSEEVGLIHDLDFKVIEGALRVLRANRRVRLAVNVSGVSFQSASFRNRLLDLLRRSNVEPSRLLFEITETATVTDMAEALRFLAALKERRHPICLDDFGAGAVTYQYLRHFDVDFVKIDGAFLRAAMANARDFALVRSIVSLCAEIGCGVVGEMIETADAAQHARAMGIGLGQGYFFGKPSTSIVAPGLQIGGP